MKIDSHLSDVLETAFAALSDPVSVRTAFEACGYHVDLSSSVVRIKQNDQDDAVEHLKNKRTKLDDMAVENKSVSLEENLGNVEDVSRRSGRVRKHKAIEDV